MLDCRVTCAVDGSCPVDTVCREGFCRVLGATSRCDCRDGETRACGASVGACTPGVQTCIGTEWGACEGAVTPSSEVCNGLDDDCDGVVDEPIAIAPPCPKTLGVCSAATQVCARGAWVECSDFSYGRDFEREETRCDGLDNDCDGLVDGTLRTRLATSAGERWFFLGAQRGFVLVTATSAGSVVRWLSPQFELEQERALAEDVAAASSWGDALITASAGAGSVTFTLHQRDAGTAVLAAAPWAGAPIVLARDVAAAQVDGGVQVLSLTDGGTPTPLGAATDATLALSQTGDTLAWSGGLVRTRDLSSLTTSSPGPLSALLELPDGGLAGVPAAQPGAPVWFPDLLSAGAPVPFSSAPTPRLASLSARVHDGRVVLAGVDPTNGMVRLVSRRFARQLSGLALSDVDRVELPEAEGVLPVVAWEAQGQVWAARWCVP